MHRRSYRAMILPVGRGWQEGIPSPKYSLIVASGHSPLSFASGRWSPSQEPRVTLEPSAKPPAPPPRVEISEPEAQKHTSKTEDECLEQLEKNKKSRVPFAETSKPPQETPTPRVVVLLFEKTLNPEFLTKVIDIQDARQQASKKQTAK